MQNLEFPKVIKAAQAATNATWALADAVLAAVKKSPSDDTVGLSASCIERMAAEIEKHVGREYGAYRLRQFERVATAFPPSKRRKGASVEICIEAGTPENLTAILKVAKEVKHKRPVSSRDVRKIIDSHNKKHKDTPKTERPPLLGEDVETFFETAEVWGSLASVLVRLRAIDESLTPGLVGKLSEAAIGSCSEDCERGAEIFRSIRAKLREHGKKGAHLTAVA
jgi:hypothetical protein